MKKLTCRKLYALIVSLPFLFSCQQPSAGNSAPEYDNLPDTVVELKKAEDVLYTYRTDYNNFIDYIEEFDANGKLVSYSKYDYSKDPDVFATGTGTVDVLLKEKNPDGNMEVSSYGRFKMGSNYTYYQMSETEDGIPNYAYYEKLSDDGKFTTEICEFDPSDSGKVLFYEVRDYSTKGQGCLQEVPVSDEIYYPGNLTASFDSSTGTITVTGDKKIESGSYSSFDENKINRCYVIDNRYDASGNIIQTFDNVEEYYWKPGNTESYWFVKLRDYNSDDIKNSLDSAVLGNESMSCRVEIKTDANGRSIITSYYTSDGWLQHQQRMVVENVTLSGTNFYNYTSTEIDAEKNIHEKFTSKYYEDTLYYVDEVTQEQKTKKVFRCNEIKEVSATESVEHSDETSASSDFTKMVKAVRNFRSR